MQRQEKKGKRQDRLSFQFFLFFPGRVVEKEKGEGTSRRAVSPREGEEKGEGGLIFSSIPRRRGEKERKKWFLEGSAQWTKEKEDRTLYAVLPGRKKGRYERGRKEEGESQEKLFPFFAGTRKKKGKKGA